MAYSKDTDPVTRELWESLGGIMVEIVAAPVAIPVQRAVPAAWVSHPHPLVRRGMVASLLSEQVAVLGESGELLPPEHMHGVQVVLFDGGSAPPEAIRSLVAADSQGERMHLVATVQTGEHRLVGSLVRSGVDAVLVLEDLSPEGLCVAVRGALQGRATMPQDLLPRLLREAAEDGRTAAAELTAREVAVLRLLADGEDTRGIARTLSYSERTVKNVVHDVLTKLHARTRAQAVGSATRSGLI